MNKADFIEQLKARTKQLSLDVILMYDEINKTDSTRIIGKQLIRSVTSTATNYRAACIARSQREFFSKMSIVVEEADETLFWLEMLRDAGFIEKNKIQPLMDESLEVLKIVSRARKNAGAK